MTRAIFSVDPGESTGVAWAVLNDGRNTMALSSMASRSHSASKTLSGPVSAQIRELYWLWVMFKRRAVNDLRIKPEDVDLVFEEFVLRPGATPGRSTTAPERVAWGFEGYRMSHADLYRERGRALPKHYTEINWQLASSAARFNNQQILKQLDAWVVGKEHERSAFAHMLLRLNIVLDQNRGGQ